MPSKFLPAFISAYSKFMPSFPISLFENMLLTTTTTFSIESKEKTKIVNSKEMKKKTDGESCFSKLFAKSVYFVLEFFADNNLQTSAFFDCH